MNNPPIISDDPSVVKLRFIFTNRNGKIIEDTMEPEITISQMKDRIKSSLELTDVLEDDKRLRIFYSGRELMDDKTLKDCAVSNLVSTPTAVHVLVSPNAPLRNDSARSQPKSGSSCVCRVS
eukprot:GHVO01013845.1.p1 GENE.GHVO01013845.1~~GHVO01013845.1.p1  ORF type:complete len:122 (+),score=14.06 GHVO01013845.1:60-425(+)